MKITIAGSLALLSVISLSACSPVKDAAKSVQNGANYVAGSTYTLSQSPQTSPNASFDSLISSAKSSVFEEIYEDTDPANLKALSDASHRGASVKVVLDTAYNGGRINAKPITVDGVSYNGVPDYLAKHNIAYHGAPTGTIYHIKTVLIDDNKAVISTGNLTPQYYTTGVDASIMDTNPSDIAALKGTLENDWNGVKPSSGTVNGGNLVWSPGAADKLVSVINSSTKTLDFTSEELKDTRIVDALVSAAKRGVKVRVLMTDSNSWHYSFNEVINAGGEVRVFGSSKSAPYIHEKEELADDSGMAFIGSQNASKTSLDRNRELGLILQQGTVNDIKSAMESNFNNLWSRASVYTKH